MGLSVAVLPSKPDLKGLRLAFINCLVIEAYFYQKSRLKREHTRNNNNNIALLRTAVHYTDSI